MSDLPRLPLMTHKELHAGVLQAVARDRHFELLTDGRAFEAVVEDDVVVVMSSAHEERPIHYADFVKVWDRWGATTRPSITRFQSTSREAGFIFALTIEGLKQIDRSERLVH